MTQIPPVDELLVNQVRAPDVDDPRKALLTLEAEHLGDFLVAIHEQSEDSFTLHFVGDEEVRATARDIMRATGFECVGQEGVIEEWRRE